jgi:hypothetical protein
MPRPATAPRSSPPASRKFLVAKRDAVSALLRDGGGAAARLCAPRPPFSPCDASGVMNRLEWAIERDVRRGLIIDNVQVVLELVAFLPLAADQRRRTGIRHRIVGTALPGDRTNQRTALPTDGKAPSGCTGPGILLTLRGSRRRSQATGPRRIRQGGCTPRQNLRSAGSRPGCAKIPTSDD